MPPSEEAFWLRGMEIPPLDRLAVAAWEIAGQNGSTSDQASLLIGHLFPHSTPPDGAPPDGAPPDTPGRWPLGKRNTVLLWARMVLLGPNLPAVAACPNCGTAMEITVPGAELLAVGAAAAAAAESGTPETITVSAAGWEVTLRLPTGDDLAYLARLSAQTGASEEQGVQTLLHRCAESAAPPPPGVEAGGDWPADLVAAVANALATADPLAEIRLQVQCETCGHVWDADWNAADFFLTELRVHAERVLDDVHRIASFYGWAERDILLLSPARRAAYRARIENG